MSSGLVKNNVYQIHLDDYERDKAELKNLKDHPTEDTTKSVHLAGAYALKWRCLRRIAQVTNLGEEGLMKRIFLAGLSKDFEYQIARAKHGHDPYGR